LTKPAGGPPQDDYLNGVLSIKTGLAPEELLCILKVIERDMGRKTAYRDHPRVIDLDILLYDDAVIRTETLIVPHPRMHERRFVLKGLTELAPDLMHPVMGKTVGEMYEELTGSLAH
jgi:dihydroneopterin aldolase/2-amino-4-hydroxy-6-hydroxymethyldihydropteridine diphosphokinase